MATASCQCQSVQLHAESVLPGIYKCYCEFCRKISGGPCQAVVGVTGLTVTAGQDQLSEYNVSGTYKRFHCATCHTFLYGQVTVAPGIPPYVAASAFDGDVTAGLPINHLFVRSKVSWHEIGDDGPRHDTYPPM